MKHIIAKTILNPIKKIYKDVSINDIHIINCKNKSFGDYSTNFVLKIAKQNNENPLEVAEKICNLILKNNIINFSLKESFLLFESKKFLNKNFKINFNYLKKEKINYEFLSANPTGDLHIGHARNVVVGDVVLRVLEYIGHKVIREYYLNDAGNQIKELSQSVYFYYCKYLKIKTKIKKEDVGYNGEEIKSYAKKLVSEKFINKTLIDLSIKDFNI
jgi:arginyl-tRNA synthetase